MCFQSFAVCWVRSQSTAQKTSKGESGVLLAVCQKHAPKQHTANPPGIPWISGKRQPPSDLYIYIYVYSYIFPSWWDVNHHITFPVWLIISPLMLTLSSKLVRWLESFLPQSSRWVKFGLLWLLTCYPWPYSSCPVKPHIKAQQVGTLQGWGPTVTLDWTATWGPTAFTD